MKVSTSFFDFSDTLFGFISVNHNFLSDRNGSWGLRWVTTVHKLLLRLFCLLFQPKGKVSALSRGKSGMILILIDNSHFYPETSDENFKFNYLKPKQ